MNQKIKHWVIIFFLVCSIFSGLLVTNLTDTTVAAWWNSDWSYYRTITIDSTLIDANLKNFPVLVVINSTTGADCNNGDSIRFLSTDNATEFEYEIDFWNNSGDSFVWVNISETITSSSNYKFLMYYGNAGASDNQDSANTFSDGFISVYHLNDNTTSTVDDSCNNYDGTKVEDNEPLEYPVGKIGKAQDFDGSNDLINCTDITELSGATTASIMGWYYADVLTGNVYYPIVSKKDDATHVFGFSLEPYFTRAAFFVSNGSNHMAYKDTQPYVNTSFWVHWCVVYNGGGATDADKAKVYINGSEITGMTYDNSPFPTALATNTAPFLIGSDADANNVNWSGKLDEIRVFNTNINASWIKASYHTQNQTTGFLTWSSAESATNTKPPTNFKATTDSITNINITWTIGLNATHTHIQRKTGSYSVSRTDGTNIYNDTGTFYNDTTLDSYTRFYYRAWSYNSTTGNWSSHADSYNNTGPANPTSVTGTVVGNDLNISWVMGTYANTTAIQRKVDSYPTSPTDGTNIYNSTGLYYVDTSVSQAYHYTLYSWDNLTKLYSSGVELEWGSLIVNCYDEETNESIDFDILVNNEDGSETYESLNNTNYLLINVDDLPLGDNIRIQISATSSVENKTQSFTGYSLNNTNSTITQVVLLQTPKSKSTTNVSTANASTGNNSYPQFTIDGDIITIPADASPEFNIINVTYQHDEYKPRTYFRDFATNQLYSLNAYLPNADDSELYRITVEDVFSIPISDALVDMKASVNGTFVTASSILTDGNGNADIFLLPGTTYLFSISKTNYETTYGTWTPSDVVFTKTFKIIASVVNITTETFSDVIVFYGEWVLVNDTLKVVFIDKNEATDDVTFSVYELYNNTATQTNTSVFSSITSTTIYYLSLNTSRMHRVDIEMNHTTLGHVTNQSIFIGPIRNDSRVNETWLEQKAEDVFGEFDQGYVNFFIVFLPCVILIITLGAVGQPGLGVSGSALYLFLLSWRVDLNNEHVMAIASIMLLFGVIMIIVKNGKKLTGRSSN